MKTLFKIVGSILPIAVITMSGCATLRGEKGGEDIAATGPTVINVRTNPGTIELDRSFRPMKGAEVLADVKDFTAKVTDVRLRFQHAPLEIPMQHVGGTTWRAQLTPEQLKLLAVSGQTISYDATIIARDENGKVAMSKDPVKVAVKAPELAQPVG